MTAWWCVNFWMSVNQYRPGPEVIKLFSCSTQLRMKFSLLINMKMPTTVGIFIFISREKFMLGYVLQERIAIVSSLRTNFMLSWVEHETSFITSGPDLNYFYSSETWLLILMQLPITNICSVRIRGPLPHLWNITVKSYWKHIHSKTLWGNKAQWLCKAEHKNTDHRH